MILAILVLLFMAMLAGCTIAQKKDGAATKEEPAVKTEVEIIEDLNRSEKLQFLLVPNGGAEYVVTDISILIRETQNKLSDYIALTVTAQSPYATFTGPLELKYKYVDDSGYVPDLIYQEFQGTYTITAPPPEDLAKAYYQEQIYQGGYRLLGTSIQPIEGQENAYIAEIQFQYPEDKYCTTTASVSHECLFINGGWTISSTNFRTPKMTREYNLPKVTEAEVAESIGRIIPAALGDFNVVLGTVIEQPGDPFNICVENCGLIVLNDLYFDASDVSIDLDMTFDERTDSWQATFINPKGAIVFNNSKEYNLRFAVIEEESNMNATLCGLQYSQTHKLYQFQVIMRRNGEDGAEYAMSLYDGVFGYQYYLKDEDYEYGYYVYLNAEFVPISYFTENYSLR